MVDGLSEETVVFIPSHGFKQENGQQLAVKIDLSDVVFMHDDVHVMDIDIDVGVLIIEGGEGDLVDALFKWGDPYHGRGTVALAVGTGVV